MKWHQGNKLSEIYGTIHSLGIDSSRQGLYNKAQLLQEKAFSFPVLISSKENKPTLGYFETPEELYAALSLWNDDENFELTELNFNQNYWVAIHIKNNYSVKVYKEKNTITQGSKGSFESKVKIIWKKIELNKIQLNQILNKSFLILERLNCSEYIILAWHFNGQNPVLNFINGK